MYNKRFQNCCIVISTCTHVHADWCWCHNVHVGYVLYRALVRQDWRSDAIHVHVGGWGDIIHACTGRVSKDTASKAKGWKSYKWEGGDQTEMWRKEEKNDREKVYTHREWRERRRGGKRRERKRESGREGEGEREHQEEESADTYCHTQSWKLLHLHDATRTCSGD